MLITRPANPDFKWKTGAVHPTVRCPECGARMALSWFDARRRLEWTCEHMPKCRGVRSAMLPSGDPDERDRLTRDQITLLRERIATFTRDERISKQDAWRMLATRVGQEDVSMVPRDQFGDVMKALDEMDRDLPRPSFVATRPAEPERCCRVVRDAYGVMTICTSSMRWCLGNRTHARHETHTDENRGVLWGDGYRSEEDLNDDAEEAFIHADSRRSR